jgi:hypothetical protein
VGVAVRTFLPPLSYTESFLTPTYFYLEVSEFWYCNSAQESGGRRPSAVPRDYTIYFPETQYVHSEGTFY